jgi:hypothetical protein
MIILIVMVCLSHIQINKNYNFEFIEPSNTTQLIGVNLDLDKHTQPNIDDLNSPRIEIVRINYSTGGSESKCFSLKSKIRRYHNTIL